jgi:multisubunit Na+/H+ antiporter MnhB subunit
MFAAGLVALHFSLQTFANQFVELLVNGFIAVAIGLAISLIAILTNPDFKHYAKTFIKKFKAKHSKQKPEIES